MSLELRWLFHINTLAHFLFLSTPDLNPYICEDLDIAVKSHSSGISNNDAERVRTASKTYMSDSEGIQQNTIITRNEKVRIYDMSKELSLENRDILKICEDLDIAVKSHSSGISNNDAERVRTASKTYMSENKVMNSHAIYICNLNYKITNKHLKQVFEDYGIVKCIYHPTDRETGRTRGFAFVEMLFEHEADAAIESLDGVELMGRDMKVSKATRNDWGGFKICH